MDFTDGVKGIGRFSKAVVLVFLAVVFLSGSWIYIHSQNNDKDQEADNGQLVHEVETVSYKEPVQETVARPIEPIRKAYTVEEGDSFFEILKDHGVSGEEALSIIKETRPVFNISRIRPGNEIRLVFSPDNQDLTGLYYDISDIEKIAVNISGDTITAQRVEMDTVEHIIPAEDSESARKDTLPSQPDEPSHAVSAREQEQKAGAGPLASGERQLDIKVKQGHSISQVLSGVGIGKAEIKSLTRSVKGVYDLSTIKPGKILSIWLTRDDPSSIRRLTYEINDKRYLDVSRHHGSFLARTRTLERDIRYENMQGRIAGSLYGSAVAGGLNPEIVMKLTDIFSHDINFFTDIQPGDTYSVLYEKYYVKDRFKGYGRVVAAGFVNQGKKYVAVYYNNERRGIQGYYDAKGNPIDKKLFLKAPLNYRRISSVYSRHRKHPIFGVVRPHLGIDYASPKGTPVCALGQGKVIFKGRIKGFGNTVRIRHPEGYVSYYAHFSKFAKGIKVGKTVDQGDTVGYVGSTGYSTGPHLDFRVSHRNKFINPLKMKNVTGPALRGSVLADFKRVSNERFAMLKSKELNIAMSRSSGEKSTGG